ncbi:MAG: peptidase S10 [Planctomycetes bacterium]|nr:peptidase S10 [Planctomycetota bacterium]
MKHPSFAFLVLLFACASSRAATSPQAKPAPAETAQSKHDADDKDTKHDGDAKKKDDDKVEIQDKEIATKHEVVIGGQKLAYTAKAGTIVLREEDGKKKASIFYVAYTKDGVEDPATRPITFSFNGGPGSSSVWLHLGALGPKRVDMGPEGFGGPPPYRLIDNEFSWLDVTDLVFIDPVTTGYSRAAPGESDDPYHSVDGDVRSVGDFIRLYATRNQRWPSPKFLVGESYGTTRAAALAEHLQSRHGMYLNGVVLVSAILNFGTAEMDVGNDLPYALFLPTLAATAFQHQKLSPELSKDLRTTLAEVERFAADDYLLALQRGSTLTDAERADIATKLARYTGLSREFVERANLRIDDGRFYKELLRNERRTVGRLDTRFVGLDRDAAGSGAEFDPSYAAIQGPFTAALNQYLRADLGYESDLVYEILTDRVHPWRFDGSENRYLNVAERLRRAMTTNPALRVFVACGYFDAATPYFASHYTFEHLGMDREVPDRITFGHYEAGHMMYIRRADLAAFTRDVRGFYARALQR